MIISVIKIDTGYGVKFPFELKDSFKGVFKTAKWNADLKQWEIGVRGKAKLDQWINLVSDTANEIMEMKAQEDESLLNTNELETLQQAMQNIRAEIARNRYDTNKVLASKELIENAKADLEKAKIDHKKVQQEKATAFLEAKELLSNICDLDLIIESHQVMNRLTGSVGKRSAFDSAAKKIGIEHDKLKAIGFESRGLSYLYYCNYNRADRDNPKTINFADYFDLIKIED